MASFIDKAVSKTKDKVLDQIKGAAQSRPLDSRALSPKFVASHQAAAASQQAASMQPSSKESVRETVRQKIQAREPTFHRKNTPSVSTKSAAVTASTAQKIRSLSTQTSAAPTNWYAGATPTSREALAEITRSTANDPARRDELLNQWYTETMDTASPYYNPYLSGSTSQAVKALTELGWDFGDEITADDLAALQAAGDYTNVGVSGTPKAPSSKSTPAQDIAYWTYQLEDDLANSDQLDAEWSALRTEMANKVELGYSDEEILRAIDWSEYPHLVKADEGIASRVPYQLARPTDYSKDALYGVLYAARNDGGTGNMTADIIQYQLGEGNRYKPNAAAEAARDPGSTSYMPYTRSTIDDAVLYFGQQTFDQEWLDKNRSLLSSGDETAAKLWQKVYDAEVTTEKAQAELEAVEEWALKKIERGATPAEIMAELTGDGDGSLKSEYPTLYKMEQARERGTAVELTQPVAFALPYMEGWLEASTDSQDAPTLSEYVGVHTERIRLSAHNLDKKIASELTGGTSDRVRALIAAKNSIGSYTQSGARPEFSFEVYDQMLDADAEISGLLASQEADKMVETTVSWLAGDGDGNSFTDKYGWIFLSSNDTAQGLYRSVLGGEATSVLNAMRDSDLVSREEYAEAAMRVARDYEAANAEGISLPEYYEKTPSAQEALRIYTKRIEYREQQAAQQAAIDEGVRIRRHNEGLAAARTSYLDAVAASSKGTASQDQIAMVSTVQSIDAAKAGQSDETYMTLIGTVARDASNEWTYANGPVGAGLYEDNVTREARAILEQDMQLAAAMGITLDDYYQRFGGAMDAQTLYSRAKESVEAKQSAIVSGMEDMPASDMALAAQSELYEQGKAADEQAAEAGTQGDLSAVGAIGRGIKTGAQQWWVGNVRVVDAYGVKVIEDAWLDSVRANFTRDEYYQYIMDNTAEGSEERAYWEQRIAEAKDVYEVGFWAGSDVLEAHIQDVEADMAATRQYVQENGSEVDQALFDYSESLTTNAISMAEALAVSYINPTLGLSVAYGAPEAAQTASALMEMGVEGDVARLAGIGKGAATVLMESLVDMNFLPQGWAYTRGSGINPAFSRFISQTTVDAFSSNAMRIAGRLVGSSISEGLQEGAETVVGNIYDYIATGTLTGTWEDLDDFVTRTLGETGRAMVMAALTTIPMTGASLAYEYSNYGKQNKQTAAIAGISKREATALSNKMLTGGVSLQAAAEAARQIYVRDILPNQAVFDSMVNRVAASDYKIAAVRGLAETFAAIKRDEIAAADTAAETAAQAYETARDKADTALAAWRQAEQEFLAHPSDTNAQQQNIALQKAFVAARKEAATANEQLQARVAEQTAVTKERNEQIGKLVAAVELEAKHYISKAENGTRAEKRKADKYAKRNDVSRIKSVQSDLNAADVAALSRIEQAEAAGERTAMMQAENGPALTPDAEKAVAGMIEAGQQAEAALKAIERMEEDMAEGLVSVDGEPIQSAVDSAREAARQYDVRRSEFVEEIYKAYSGFDLEGQDPVAYAEERYKADLAARSATRAEETQAQATGQAEQVDTTTETPAGIEAMKGRGRSSTPGTVSPDVTRPAKPGDNSTTLDKKIKNPIHTMQKLADSLGVGKDFAARRRINAGDGVEAYYDTRNGSVVGTPEFAADYGVQAHELGHHIYEKLHLTIPQSMIDAVDPDFLKLYDKSKHATETFSVFFSHYIAGDVDINAIATPQWIQQFEKSMRDAKIYKAVKRAQADIQSFAAANTISRTNAMIVPVDSRGDRKAFLDGVIGRNRESIAAKLFDDTRYAKAVDDAAREAGYDKPTLRTSARYWNKHTAGITENLLTRNFADADGNILGDSLEKTLERIGVTADHYDLIVSYLTAKHALDRNNHVLTDREGNETPDPLITFDQNVVAGAEEVAALVAALESSADRNVRIAIDGAQAIVGFYKQFMEVWAVGEGMLSEKAWKQFQKNFPNYVPLAREGFDSFDSMKSATGSTRNIKNPLQNLFIGMDKMVQRVCRNRLAQTFDDIYTGSGALGLFARPYEIIDQGSIDVLSEEDIAKAEARVAAMNGNAFDLIDALNEILAARRVSHTGNATEMEQSLRVIRRDGKVANYVIENKELYNLLSGNGTAQMSEGLKAIGRVTSSISQLQTGRSPLFLVKNAARDFQKSVNYGSWASNYATGIIKWSRAFYEVARKSEKYQEYAAMGNAGWHLREQIRDTRGSNNELMGSLFKGWRGESSKAGAAAKHAAAKMFDIVSLAKLNEIVEQTSRFAEYRFGKHDTTTAEGRREAYMAAQEATVDFSLSGSSKSLAIARKIVPFLNATIQGAYQTAYMFDKSQRDRLAPRLAKTIVNNMLTAILPIALMQAWGSDEDRELYALLPDEMKASNIIFPTRLLGIKDPDRRFVRIPIAQDPMAQMAYVMGLEAGSRIVSGNAYGADIDLWATTHNIITGMVPDTTIFSPLIDIGKNENWYGSPIISQSLQGKAKYEQKHETTPEVFNWAARQLHSIGINVSPLNIQYFLEQTTGVFGQILIPAMSPDPYDPGQNAAERLFGTMADKLINSLTLDPAYSNDASDNFYSQWDKLEQIAGLGENEWGDLKPGLSAADKEAAQERAKELYKKGGPMYEAKQTIKENNEAMEGIMASETLTPEQKRDQVRALRDANVQAMLDGMRACSDFFSEYVETPPNWQRLIFGAE